MRPQWNVNIKSLYWYFRRFKERYFVSILGLASDVGNNRNSDSHLMNEKLRRFIVKYFLLILKKYWKLSNLDFQHFESCAFSIHWETVIFQRFSGCSCFNIFWNWFYCCSCSEILGLLFHRSNYRINPWKCRKFTENVKVNFCSLWMIRNSNLVLEQNRNGKNSKRNILLQYEYLRYLLNLVYVVMV